MLRRRRSRDPLAAVVPAQLPLRWQGAVAEALAARARYRDLVSRLRDGPLRARLDELGEKVDAGVWAVWETATRAADLEAVVGVVDADEAVALHKQALRELKAAQQQGRVDPAVEERARLQAERHASVQRLLNALDDTGARLAVLDARLDALVVRAAELALHPGDAESIGAELDAVVAELGHLRSALDTLGRR